MAATSALAAGLRRVVPPIVRHRLRSVIQYPATLQLVSDVESFRRFRRIERPSAQWREPSVPIRVRPLGGRPLFVRPHTDDNWVLRTTFLQGYHLPPRGVEFGPTPRIWDLGASIGATAADMAVRFAHATIVCVELDE